MSEVLTRLTVVIDYGLSGFANLVKNLLSKFNGDSIAEANSVLSKKEFPDNEDVSAIIFSVDSCGSKVQMKLLTANVEQTKEYVEHMIKGSSIPAVSFEFTISSCKEIADNCDADGCKYVMTYVFETNGDFSIKRMPWVGLVVTRPNYFAGIKQFNSMKELREFAKRFCAEAVEVSGVADLISTGICEAVQNLEFSNIGVKVWKEHYAGSMVCITRVEQESVEAMNVF